MAENQTTSTDQKPQPTITPITLDSFQNTSQIITSDKIADQIIGQERAITIARKAASQKRNVLLIGSPGTGKSLIAQAISELLPVTELEDILIYPNHEDENNPVVKIVKAGEGQKTVKEARFNGKLGGANPSVIMMIIIIIASFLLLTFGRPHLGDVITAAMLIGLFVMAGMMAFAAQMGRGNKLFQTLNDAENPKLLIDNANNKKAPFHDATGAKAGSLLGDVRHDPLQSGGLGTPAHLRVEAGMIHRANKGVLFIDEVATLRAKSQQELLTAMQDKRYGITGQSEMSSGAQVKTQAVPCDFVLVAAGNMQDLQQMHPALRSRIRGYGYEVFMEDSMTDNVANQFKIIQFIAQEVKKDTKIPHFSREAALLIVEEARKRAGRKNKLTLRLRELGGLIRAAGDLAQQEGKQLVTAEQVERAKLLAVTLEQQMARQMLESRKDYNVFGVKGAAEGQVNGMAVMGDAGIVLPIVAEVTHAASKEEGKIIVTGKLGKIAKEAVENVSAIIKKHMGKDISKFDIHIQFLQTYEGVEGDSASIAVATAVISALEGIPIRQDVSMTGSLSIRGQVLPIGGVTAKSEAAIAAGIRTIIVPKSNYDDLVLTKEQKAKVEIIPVENLAQVLEHALQDGKGKKELLKTIKLELN